MGEFQRSGLVESREMGQNQLEEHLNGGCAWSRQDGTGQNVERKKTMDGADIRKTGIVVSSNDSYHEAMYPWLVL